MSIKSFQIAASGQSGVIPQNIWVDTDDDFETITTPGYLDGLIKMNPGSVLSPANVSISYLAQGLKVQANLTLVYIAQIGGSILFSHAGSFGQVGDVPVFGPDGFLLSSNASPSSNGFRDNSFCIVQDSKGAVVPGDIPSFYDENGTVTDQNGYNLSDPNSQKIASVTTPVVNGNLAKYEFDGETAFHLADANISIGLIGAAGSASGSAGNATHCAAQFVLPVVINGDTYYLAAFSQNT